MPFDYARFLAAKTTVDDRAFNRQVLAELGPLMPAGAPRVLEVGAGLGTMAGRLLDWGFVNAGEYILLDADRQLLDDSRRWLRDWAAARGLRSDPLPDGLQLGDLRVRLVHADLGRYLEAGHRAPAEVLIASAFLDLVDVPAVLPGLLRLLVPGGAYWFAMNYDGESIFEPGHPCDDKVMRAYHRDMDERSGHGGPPGESQTGRRLFGYLRAAGAPALAAGSSDWVVSASPEGDYPGDEAYFLRSILNTIQNALRNRENQAEPADLADWLAVRRRQLAAGELVYIAHQLDFAGRSPGGADTTLTRACVPSCPTSRGRDTTPPAPGPTAPPATAPAPTADPMVPIIAPHQPAWPAASCSISRRAPYTIPRAGPACRPVLGARA